MKRHTSRRPAFLALVIAFTVSAVGIAFANDYEPVRPPPPQQGFAAPVVMVCRATDTMINRPGLPGACTTGIDNLMNGEVVQVTVSAFVTNATGGTLQQCTLDLTRCEAATVPFTTGSTRRPTPSASPTTPQILSSPPRTSPSSPPSWPPTVKRSTAWSRPV